MSKYVFILVLIVSVFISTGLRAQTKTEVGNVVGDTAKLTKTVTTVETMTLNRMSGKCEWLQNNYDMCISACGQRFTNEINECNTILNKMKDAGVK